jgi:hypothetical protein
MEYAVGQMVAPGLVVISLDSALKLGELEKERDDLLLRRDDYKAKWEKLMAAIGPYSTTDIAAKMAESARLQNGALMKVFGAAKDLVEFQKKWESRQDGENAARNLMVGWTSLVRCLLQAQEVVPLKQKEEPHE